MVASASINDYSIQLSTSTYLVDWSIFSYLSRKRQFFQTRSKPIAVKDKIENFLSSNSTFKAKSAETLLNIRSPK